MEPSIVLESNNGTQQPKIPGETVFTQDAGRLENDKLEPIAVIGYSCRFPQDAYNPQKFWELLSNARCTSTPVPKDRFNVESFYHPDPARVNSYNIKGGHFLKEDPGFFDAPFFSMSPSEAACMDPQQRILMESAYRCFENAGIPLEKATGSKTAVYVGNFTRDYEKMVLRDPELYGRYTAVGSGNSILANRLSWFFDLTGPSIALDTACSSSLNALHLACNSLRNHEAEMGLIGGCNIICTPDDIITMTNLNFLSPDAKCYSFDHRGNGYARGEGFGTVLLKRLSDAVRDGDVIRAVVRASGSNQDGRTPGITQPAAAAQEALIRHVYNAGGMDLATTRFFEAHGTGTPLGDPLEASAIKSVFREHRTPDQPLYIGAVKSNIGHLEAASGVAGMIKSIMILEKGIMCPNTSFEKVNPKIPVKQWNIAFPLENTPWPQEGVRRLSLNSFGYGGSNAHCVIEDAYHYLKARKIVAKHNTVAVPPSLSSLRLRNGTSFASSKSVPNPYSNEALPKLLVYSTSDEAGIARTAAAYSEYLSTLENKDFRYFERLAYTLSNKRSQLPWKSFVISNTAPNLKEKLDAGMQKPVRANNAPKLGFIFTGQGAQWAQMGRELLVYSTFRKSLQKADQYMKVTLGGGWSVMEELFKDDKSTRINNPQFSQPLCTVLQIGLLKLLATWNIYPAAVVGHSSGEIGAAYAIGALDEESAYKVAFHRGALAATLAKPDETDKGSMMATGMSEADAQTYLLKLATKHPKIDVFVGCVNSPVNVTLTGSEEQIHTLKPMLDADKIFARQLKVDIAYHSPRMNVIAGRYNELISDIKPGKLTPEQGTPVMFSSVYGKLQTDLSELARGDYWVKNMVSAVRFADALKAMVSPAAKKLGAKLGQKSTPAVTIDQLLEVGPHAALAGPTKQILEGANKKSIKYQSIIKRGTSPVETSLEVAGNLHCTGYPVNIFRANTTNADAKEPDMLLDLPEYVFNHTNRFWLESRLSKNYRFRKHAGHELLGATTFDWNPSEAVWRHFLRAAENPWMKDHKISGAECYPGAGMMVMAIEAASQIADESRKITGFRLHNVLFKKALVIPSGEDVETHLYLRPRSSVDKPSTQIFDWRLCCYDNEEWIENATGDVCIEYEEAEIEVDGGKEVEQQMAALKASYEKNSALCKMPTAQKHMYEYLDNLGLGFGNAFTTMSNITHDDNGSALVSIHLRDWTTKVSETRIHDHIVHPTALDSLLQSTFVALSKGARVPLPTMVPTGIKELWISSSLSSKNEGADETKLLTKAGWVGYREVNADTIAVDAATKDVQMLINGFEATAIASGAASQSGDMSGWRRLCYNIDWKPDFDLATNAEIASFLETSSGDVSPFKAYIDALVHKNPSQTILEVGAQTGTITAPIIDVITRHGAREAGAPRYRQYQFTEATADLLDKAKQLFSEQGNRMKFSALDTAKDLKEQGFETETVDLLIVSTSEGLTPSSIQSLRSLVKTGGRLILVERSNDAEKWNSLLADNGFSGNDVVLRNQKDFQKQSFTAIISSAGVVEDITANVNKTMIVATKGSLQTDVAKKLASDLEAAGVKNVTVNTLADLSSTPLADTYVVFLPELDEPFLATVTEDKYAHLHKMVTSASGILWATQGGEKNAKKPEYDLVFGLQRCSDSENAAVKFVTLSCETLEAPHISTQLTKLFKRSFVQPYGRFETEYAERKGLICCHRVVEANYLNDDLFLKTQPQSAERSTVGAHSTRHLELQIKTPGQLHSLQLADDLSFDQLLKDDEVEIDVKATGLTYKDVLVTLGQIPGSHLGLECSGVVVKAGPKTDFKKGDRVAAVTVGAFKTQVRAKASTVVKIPEAMDFTQAAALPVAFSLAYHSLYNVARIRSGESVLIHSGAGAMGQAAIQVAKTLGAKVFTTVGTDEKKKLLQDLYNIPADHIFSSRSLSFVQAIKRLTNGRGVDTVINSLAGQGLQASFDTLAPMGRFIEIGKRDIINNTALPMAAFSKNITFTSVDVATLVQEQPEVFSELLKSVMTLLSEKKIKSIEPLNVYEGGRMVAAFEYLQSGKNVGKTIIQVSDSDIVPIVPDTRPQYSFDANASYIVAGGLGGLGLSMSRWMVSRGAKNLVLLSRSGPTTAAAKRLLSDLKEQGVNVLTPTVDVSNAARVAEVCKQCAETMPPIKGAILGQMNLRDALFENMTCDEYLAAVQPKVNGSQNLHDNLPKGMDFFIMLASASGVVGTRGQANYSSGNTFQDALARHRVGQGEKATSLDLGVILSVGFTAERQDLTNQLRSTGYMATREDELHAMLDHYCNPGLEIQSNLHCQVFTGIETPGMIAARGMDEPFWMQKPIFRTIFQMDEVDEDAAAGGSSFDFAGLMKAADSLQAAGAAVTEALLIKISKSLNVSMEDVDSKKPMHTYGVDSLVAVEIRNWFAREIKADVAVFEILGNGSMETLGVNAAQKSALLPAALAA